MPNIVITEGLDTPWELQKTELNVTQDTNLENINLTNQVVGQLAYTSSELLAGLKREKDNLDKIVDAMDSVTAEIGLFPTRIAEWDKARVSIDKVNLSAIPVPIPLSIIATTSDVSNTDISQAHAADFSALPPPSQDQKAKNQAFIDTIAPLIDAKPLLDAQGMDFSIKGYAFLVSPPTASSGPDQAMWFATGELVEGNTPGSGGGPLDLVVYRNAAGQPTSYEFVGNQRIVLQPSQVLSFFVPQDPLELGLMRIATNDPRLGKINLSAIPVPIPLSFFATTSDVSNTDVLQAHAAEFSLITPASPDQKARNQAFIESIAPLIAAKPLLDAQKISYPIKGYAFLASPLIPSSGSDQAIWFTTDKLVEGVTPGSGGTALDLVVYRNTAGEPTSYEFVGNQRIVLEPSQVFSFFVPKDAAEKTSMQSAINAQNLITATNALKNTTGLPEGATPPVTTLGPDIEKYCDTAKYTTIEITRQPNGILNSSPGQTPKVIYGAYPPLSRPDLDLGKMTVNDINKFFQEPGTNRIFYIEDVTTDGKIYYRLVTAKEPFIQNMTDDIKRTLRGDYTEKQILLTQRSTDQTVFVNSISQRYTSFSDMATNLLKALMNFFNDIARNIRS